MKSFGTKAGTTFQSFVAVEKERNLKKFLKEILNFASFMCKLNGVFFYRAIIFHMKTQTKCGEPSKLNPFNKSCGIKEATDIFNLSEALVGKLGGTEMGKGS